ncbi:DUF1501 domain-containing protein [Planctomicrobium piriforme]|uniref:Tat (Twin-arginine translocation) pathway signal sequence n=1 Tax=Planctomicrobium piriforme TaxID=1576369 RepID=A0A1I3G201_9PLAN|nr:DUF1501 domain-containing protein [Planctomicrobium piriforme]SFI17476.1 Protein of unknown function [Planctomicrobium piriforme]
MAVYLSEQVTLSRGQVSRRRFLQTLAVSGAGVLSFRDMMAVHAEELRKQGRSLILLWMNGGPSQFETFDPKPNHENGGETKAIATSIPGVQIAHDWEQTAKVMQDIALIRSMTNKEGNHQRATYQLHTGYIPSGSVKHPSFGSCVAQQLADANAELPGVISIGRTEGAGFLGVDYEPFVVDNPGQMPQNVRSAKPQDRLERRLGLLERLDSEFARRGAATAVENHRQLYNKAAKLVLSPATKAFDLSTESQATRDQYGNSQFGRGCLLARRLVESGVTFVEVRADGWDTHDDNFSRISNLASQVDPGSAALVADLKARGLLERTVVVWTGEFGRTPQVNARGGRDHFPRAFNCWVAGGGIKGGQVIGSTSDDGNSITDRPVSVADLLQSVSRALHINPAFENISPLGRPLKVVDGGEPIPELFS